MAPKNSINVSGKCALKFAEVEKVFRELFNTGWEYEGASVCIFHKGQMVVDLFGGYADKQTGLKWTENTRTVIFSLTKGIAAIAMAMLVEQGRVSYADKVASFWPEFAQNGKSEITVDWILNHKAGLAVFDEPITLEDAENPERMAHLIERTRPNWEPGTKSGYHAVTYGWLIDQIVRRVDAKGRGVAQFIREEITQKYDIDLHIGINSQLLPSVSRLSLPSWGYIFRECLSDPRVLVILGIIHLKTKSSLRSRVAHNPDWLKVEKDCCMFNNPRVLQLEQAGALGISRARDVAKIFALLLEGRLVSREMLEEFKRPQCSGWDNVVGVPLHKGHGFFYEPHPFKRVDPEEELVVVYITNGLKTGMGQIARSFNKLTKAAYNSIKKLENDFGEQQKEHS